MSNVMKISFFSHKKEKLLNICVIEMKNPLFYWKLEILAKWVFLGANAQPLGTSLAGSKMP